MQVQSGASTKVVRPDIESLRAISVTAVVLYHARLPGFSGGFCGVDIFFVISGYLITGLLLRELDTSGSVNLSAFWARRAWRLLPNSLAVLLVTVVAGSILLPADQHTDLGRDVLSTLAYVANYHFALRAVDYFDTSITTTPILHFWSLSVEEQFYFFWPCLLVVLTWISGRHSHQAVLGTIIAILFGSFVTSLVLMSFSQPQAFFDTEARAWQLSVGGVLSVVAPRVAKTPQLARALATAVGLSGILASILLLDDRTAYPGWRALLPVVSAALVIGGGTGAQAPLNWIFASSPLLWVGRRSYSIYLWHLPILQFVPMALPHVSGVKLLAIPFLLIVSAMAFALIEEPVRHGKTSRWPVRNKLLIAASASVFVAALSFGLMHADAFHGQLQAELIRRIQAAKSDGPRMVAKACQLGWGEPGLPPCRFGAANSARTVILFGDSYAAHLFDGLESAAQTSGWSVEAWTKPACPPLDIQTYSEALRGPDTPCADWRNKAIEQLIARRPALVVIATATSIAGKLGDPVTGHRLSRALSQLVWRDGFKVVLERLRAAGLQVAVVRSTPRGLGGNLLPCLGVGAGNQCPMAKPRSLDPNPPDAEIARQVDGVRLLDLSDRFCGPNACYSARNGSIVYRDGASHITATFSLTLAPDFAALLGAVNTVP